jgi:hypothetical protein
MERGTPPSLVQQIGRKRGLTAALWCVAALLALVLFAPPLHAQTIAVEEWVVEDEPVELSWSETVDADDSAADGHQRFAEVDGANARTSRPALATFGPFHVLDGITVEMIGTVDSTTPAAFAAMMRSHPSLSRLVMVECPGSLDEASNLSLARAVRRAGISTHVPANGSIRSGAVELWLAGATRTAAEGAEFAVHSWRDEDGREARDYAAGDPVHAEYLGFYREMGIADATARRFYALTNSVGFDDLRTLGVGDMAALGLVTTG